MEEVVSVIEEWPKIEWNARVFFQKLPVQSPHFHIREMACHLYFEEKSHQEISQEYFELILRGKSADPPEFVSFSSKVYIVDMRRNIRFEEINVVTISEKSFEYCIWRASKERLLANRSNMVGDCEWLNFKCVFGPSEDDPSYKEIRLKLRKFFKKRTTVDILSSDYLELFKQGPMKDVTIICKDETVHAHKILLSVRSKTFAELFQNDKVVNLLNMLSLVLRPILYYIYTGKLPELTLANMYVIYEASHSFQLDALKLACANFMISELSSKNSFKCLNYAKKCNDKRLKIAIGAFIRSRKEFCDPDTWRVFLTQFKNVTSWNLEDEKFQKILSKINIGQPSLPIYLMLDV